MALAQAERALTESREVLGALARAEKAEDAHRQAEARLARAIRGTSDGPWECDVPTGRYWLAPHWRTMLGYDESELQDPTIDTAALARASRRSADTAGGIPEVPRYRRRLRR